MHVLTVLDHPNPNSFSHAVAAQFMAGAEEAGHTTELGDLHAERFDPLWNMIDANEAITPQIAGERARIERADAICLVFPLFWWGMPSMIKGWVDRVWGWGWAYDQLDDPNLSLQRRRPGVFLVPAGARSDEIEDRGYQQAMEKLWIDGSFGYFGLVPRRVEFLCGSTGSDARRADLLRRSFEAGRTIAG